jgi:hypothetical protein
MRSTVIGALADRRWLTARAMALLLAAMATVPAAVSASEEGRRNTTLLLGGAAIYSLARGKTAQGAALGAAGLYAYKRYRDEKSDHRARRAARYGYARGYRAGRVHRRR